jgi:hypothetical protein
MLGPQTADAYMLLGLVMSRVVADPVWLWHIRALHVQCLQPLPLRDVQLPCGSGRVRGVPPDGSILSHGQQGPGSVHVPLGTCMRRRPGTNTVWYRDLCPRWQRSVQSLPSIYRQSRRRGLLCPGVPWVCGLHNAGHVR